MAEPEYFQPVLKILMAIIITVAVSVATVAYAVRFFQRYSFLGLRRQNLRHGHS
jgi:hypothetical protein